jgi:hypothetical protein
MSHVAEAFAMTDLSGLALTHYASAQIPQLDSREYIQDRRFKPSGLWVSVDGEYDWPSWCKSEEFMLSDLAIRHRVILHSDAHIIRLGTSSDIDIFTRRFKLDGHDGYSIDWERVKLQWQGIIITPYCWDRRLSYHAGWYYSWDCASGCIWDVTAVMAFEAFEVTEEEEASVCD